ncbi:hypothetical protein F418_p58 [Hafnia phage Enc34]|uniref:DUF7609 domain-containing protein n=1 Tax=Hafnia phage Enc34 TaxID=1150990 RepID=H6WYM0_9CAUD|nr:hypothetical protein F418_p58 [Hafnia phage Enc34]AFB84075.1 hypothetical protein [Hafnia phage Enc34]
MTTKTTNQPYPDNLTAAMMTCESDVELPSRVRPHSVAGNLIALKPGEVYTLSLEMAGDVTLAQAQADANGLKSKIRSSLNSSIRNAMRHHGQKFSMESALITYPSGRMFIQVVVTCLEAGVDDDDEV